MHCSMSLVTFAYLKNFTNLISESVIGQFKNFCLTSKKQGTVPLKDKRTKKRVCNAL